MRAHTARLELAQQLQSGTLVLLQSRGRVSQAPQLSSYLSPGAREGVRPAIPSAHRFHDNGSDLISLFHSSPPCKVIDVPDGVPFSVLRNGLAGMVIRRSLLIGYPRFVTGLLHGH